MINPLSQGGRPPLPLGAMTGDEDYVTKRSQALVEVFSDIVEVPLKLVKAPSGSTDCRTFIRAPLHHPEGYLVVEHELSHVLFSTNLPLMEDCRTKTVERMMHRAGWAITDPKCGPQKARLEMTFQYLWNVLEDYRCCGLWAQLYPEGGRLLKQRWHDISAYEREEAAEKELLEYLGRCAASVDTPNAPDRFKRCKPHMQRALNLVEGVDAASALAITRRLIDDIIDELLEDVPPPDPNQPPPNPQQQAQQKIDQLLGACGNMSGAIDPDDENGLGSGDVSHGDKKQELTAAQRNQVARIMTARNDDDAGDGKSSFASLIEAGAQQMEDKIEHARMAMSLPKKSEEQKQETAMQAAIKRAGIHSRKVQPTRELPPPTEAAMRTKAHLDKVRMKARRRLAEEGDDIDIEALIEAKMNNELDEANIFEKKKMEGGLDLLLLVDLSGSMHGVGVQMVEQALADVNFACSDQRVRLELWGFSDELFLFPKVGSPRDAKGVSMCGTSMVQAIEVAQHWASSAKTSRAIVLMTDGLPTTCRAHDSTGNPNKDLANLLEEMRSDKIVLSVLAIGSKSSAKLYDDTFGPGNYGLVGGLPDMLEALPETCKVLVESHIMRSCR